MSAKKALLIDLAGTADDFAALAYAAGCGSFALAGLTVYGRGADEVRRMAAALDLGCEVASGAIQPLLQGEPGAVCAPAPALPFTQKAPAAQHSAGIWFLRTVPIHVLTTQHIRQDRTFFRPPRRAREAAAASRDG